MAGDSNIGDEIIRSTRDVFATMLMIDLENEAAIEDQKCDIESNLTSMIGLGGGLRGMLAVHCPAEVAKAITSDFLGMEVEEIDEDVKDAIGEIANMVAGNMKVFFTSIDINVELAIPTSIAGESFLITGIAEAKRIVVPFNVPAGKFWVELMCVVNG